MAPDSFTVSEFINVMNGTFEQFATVTVEGEISSSSNASSGHWYFSLKDEGSSLECAMFRGNINFIRGTYKIGDRVRVTGKPNLYAPTGRFKLLGRSIEKAGAGKLYELFLRLKNELAALGWFDEARKKPIPRVPEVIGIVTSESAAALRDVMNRLNERAPYARTILYHTPVQGKGAEFEIARQIQKANQEGLADVLLVVRGGGSLEDLWCFNERVVAEAIVQSDIPVISGVGHETDFTIADLAADKRAPTPTGAAEAAAERKSVLENEINSAWTSISRTMDNRLNRSWQDVAYFSAPFENAEAFMKPLKERVKVSGRIQPPKLEHLEQRKDAAWNRISDRVSDVFKRCRSQKEFAGRLFLEPGRFMEVYKNSLLLSDKLEEAMTNYLAGKKTGVKLCSPVLNYAFSLQGSAVESYFSTLRFGVVGKIRRSDEALKKEGEWLRRGRPKIDRTSLDAACLQIRQEMSRKMDTRQLQLQSLDRMWSMLNPSKKLVNTEAVVYLRGKAVDSVRLIKGGDEVDVFLRDGSFVARVGEVRKN